MSDVVVDLMRYLGCCAIWRQVKGIAAACGMAVDNESSSDTKQQQQQQQQQQQHIVLSRAGLKLVILYDMQHLAIRCNVECMDFNRNHLDALENLFKDRVAGVVHSAAPLRSFFALCSSSSTQAIKQVIEVSMMPKIQLLFTSPSKSILYDLETIAPNSMRQEGVTVVSMTDRRSIPHVPYPRRPGMPCVIVNQSAIQVIFRVMDNARDIPISVPCSDSIRPGLWVPSEHVHLYPTINQILERPNGTLKEAFETLLG